jgi:capsule polysaccharide export protein KpsE/RkpR
LDRRTSIRLRRQKLVYDSDEGEELPPTERKIAKILQNSQEARTKADMFSLMEFFMSASCFKELDIKEQDLFKVVQKMEYKKCLAKETIFSIGEEGDNFYILVHGRVQLFLPNPEIQAV